MSHPWEWSGVCRHQKTEPVQTYGGETIAIRCKGCTKILAHVGKCDGCEEKDVRLTDHIVARGLRFCSPDCLSRFRAREQEATRVDIGVR